MYRINERSRNSKLDCSGDERVLILTLNDGLITENFQPDSIIILLYCYIDYYSVLLYVIYVIQRFLIWFLHFFSHFILHVSLPKIEIQETISNKLTISSDTLKKSNKIVEESSYSGELRGTTFLILQLFHSAMHYKNCRQNHQTSKNVRFSENRRNEIIFQIAYTLSRANIWLLNTRTCFVNCKLHPFLEITTVSVNRQEYGSTSGRARVGSWSIFTVSP